MTLLQIARLPLRLALLSLLLSAAAIAQDGPPPGMGGPQQNSPSADIKRYNAAKELTRLTKKYKLTEDQTSKVRPILVEQEKQIKALTDDDNLSDREWVAGVKKVHEQTVEQVKAQLTDAQSLRYAKDEEKQAQADAEQESMPQGPGGGGPPPGGPPPGV